jgi:hypothetical protein
MKHLPVHTTVAVLAAALIAAPALAQKGTGEPTGIGRQANKPPIVSLSGTVKDVKVGPCKLTTGRSSEGAHLILQAQDKTINLHLGPSAAVDDVLKATTVGQQVTVEGFRTDRMPQDAYVAKTLKTGDKTFALRDDNLRPKWAMGRGGGRGLGLGAGRGRNFGGCF